MSGQLRLVRWKAGQYWQGAGSPCSEGRKMIHPSTHDDRMQTGLAPNRAKFRPNAIRIFRPSVRPSKGPSKGGSLSTALQQFGGSSHPGASSPAEDRTVIELAFALFSSRSVVPLDGVCLNLIISPFPLPPATTVRNAEDGSEYNKTHTATGEKPHFRIFD